LLKTYAEAPTVLLLAFWRLALAQFPLMRLGTSSHLLDVADSVFLKVNGRLKRLGGLVAELHHALALGRLGFDGPDPLKLPKEFLYLSLVTLGSAKGHFDRRFAVAGAVLDLRQVGH
jgi:hypothetical protein